MATLALNKLNKDGRHLLVNGRSHKTVNLSATGIMSNDCKNLLDVKTDLLLKFEEHFRNTFIKKF